MNVTRAVAILACGTALAAASAACGSRHSGSHQEVPTVLTVTAPIAGSELSADDTPAIVVAGNVESPVAVSDLEVWVNDTLVKLGPDGTFSTAIDPKVGVNHIKVEVYDGRAPDEPVTRELDVLWAPGYLAPLAGSTGFDVPGAIQLRLGQRLFDARLLDTDLDLTTNPIVARDLASMVELVLWKADLASLLNGSIQLGSGDTSLDVTIPGVSPTGVVVDAEIVDDPVQGIDLYIDMTGVYVAMNGTLAIAGNSWQIDGGIAADMHAYARIAVADSAGNVVATVSDATASVGPLTPMFTGPDGDALNAFVTLGQNDLHTLLESLVSDQLIPTFTDQLPGAFESVLGALDSTLSNVSFTLDSPLGGDPVEVSLLGTMGGLTFTNGPPIGAVPGSVLVQQNLSVRTTGAPIHPDSRGALEPAPPGVAPPFSDGTGMNLAVRVDFVNALLHALWDDGLLEGQLDVLGTPALVSAKLPPIVRDTPMDLSCDVAGERCDLVLQIGQLEVEFPDMEQRFVIDVTVGAKIDIGASEISLALQETPDVHVWLDTPKTDGPGFTPDALQTVFVNVLWPSISDAIAGNLSVALPVPSIADLGLADVAPDLQNATLGITVQQVGVDSGYLHLDGDLTLEAP